MPLFISVAASAVLQFIYSIVAAIGLYFAYSQNLESLLADLELGTPTLLLASTYLFSCVGFCLAPLAHSGTGLLYAYLHQRESHLTMEEGALGGALAAGTARIVAGLFSMFISTMVSWFATRGLYQATAPSIPTDLATVSLLSSILSSLPGLCFGVIIAAVLGGVGGLLGGSIFHSRYSE